LKGIAARKACKGSGDVFIHLERSFALVCLVVGDGVQVRASLSLPSQLIGGAVASVKRLLQSTDVPAVQEISVPRVTGRWLVVSNRYLAVA
jgi:hypothetical protein